MENFRFKKVYNRRYSLYEFQLMACPAATQNLELNEQDKIEMLQLKLNLH